MAESAGGFPVPKVDDALCTRCGLCLKSCPGATPGEPGEGIPERCFVAHATSGDVRAAGASGGAVTALLESLLESGAITGALLAKDFGDGSLRPKGFVARTAEEIRSAAGSHYVSAPALAALPNRIPEDDRLAVVGLPCQIRALENATRRNASWRDRVVLKIGLVCDRSLSARVADYAKWRAGADDAVRITWRDKGARLPDGRTGWPGAIRVETASGKEIALPTQERMWVKDRFTGLHCRLCEDKFNSRADVVFGDPYGVSDAPEGESAVLVRTDRGAEALENARAAGFLETRRVEKAALEAKHKAKSARPRTEEERALFELSRNVSLRGVPDGDFPGIAALYESRLRRERRGRLRRRIVRIAKKPLSVLRTLLRKAARHG